MIENALSTLDQIEQNATTLRSQLLELQAAGTDTTEEKAATQPFKCPACGAEYPEQVACANQHPPEQTLPTEQVLAGAETGQEPSAATVETPAETPAETPHVDGDNAEPPAAPGPTWPTA